VKELYKCSTICFSSAYAYTLRRKGSIYNHKRFYQHYVFGTPKRFYIEPFFFVKGSTVYTLKKGFLWVLYRTLGFHNWPIEPFSLKKKRFYIEPFWSSIYEAGDGTISGSK